MSTMVEGRQIALELHALLNDLEPARWRDEKLDEIITRQRNIQSRMEAMLERWASEADEKRAAMLARYQEVSEVIATHRERPEPSSLDEWREAWMAFRDRAEPAYEALAASLKAHDVVVPSLRPSNYTRNLFHVGAACLALAVVEYLPLLFGTGFWVVAVVAGALAATAWGMEISRRISPAANAAMMRVFRHVSHPHEAHHVNSSTWYVTALFLLSLTGSPLACAAALGVLGLADPAAAIIGKRWGRVRFENGRSLEGTLTFIVVGWLTAAATVVGFHSGEAPLWMLLVICAGASLAGALAELYSTRVDDNLSIPVAAGAAAWALLTALS